MMMMSCFPQSMSMASLLYLNCSLSLQQYSSHSSSSSCSPSSSSQSFSRNKIVDSLSSVGSSTATNNRSHRSLRPIVVVGDPPTYVSAPGRRIVAGSISSSRALFFLLVLVAGLWSV